MADKERNATDKFGDNGSAKCGEEYWYFSAPKYNFYRIIEMSDELTELLLCEKERQTKAKEYCENRYKSYSVNTELTFNCRDLAYSICINKINSDLTIFPIHLVCV